MSVTASEVFDFLQSREAGVIERQEISSASFGTLRRCLQQIVLKLHDSDDGGHELSEQLRMLLCEWLTVPVSFSAMPDAVLGVFGTPEDTRTRWGVSIENLYRDCARAADGLKASESPLRIRCREVIRELRSQERTFKILCHRRARAHFESLLPGAPPLDSGIFIHSLRDYRNVKPFDALLKVGPLRSAGWGSAPDAILTAPRFGSLIQLVWSGCSDEEGFGYDPASPTLGSSDDTETGRAARVRARSGTVTWTRHVARFGDDSDVLEDSNTGIDELQVFRELSQRREERHAVLVQIDEHHGILYPSHSTVLSFDSNPATREPIGNRIPAETLVEGMYIIIPVVDDIDLGTVQAEDGQYSRCWKERLTELWHADADALVERLEADGLKLDNLRAAIERWCKPPSTVIHAPQRIRHFEILLRVLDLTSGPTQSTGPRRVPFWRLAWNEIRRSRGEAIQAGFQEHEILAGELHNILSNLLPEIRAKAAAKAPFDAVIPATSGITGTIHFFHVCGLEEGFTVPDAEIKTVLPLAAIEQWRD